jgi:hypothetical protein
MMSSGRPARKPRAFTARSIGERLDQDLNTLREDFAGCFLIHQRQAGGLDFARVVAAADAKDDPLAGQDIGHRVILGQPQRVPHRHDAELQPISIGAW